MASAALGLLSPSGLYPDIASALAAQDDRLAMSLFARELLEPDPSKVSLVLEVLRLFVDRGVGRGSVPHGDCIVSLPSVMRAHQSLRGKTCEVLCALARHSANAAEAIDACIPELLLAQLNELSEGGNPPREIVVPACRALANYAISSAGQARLVAAGAVPTLIPIARATQDWPKHSESVAAAFGALLNLADCEAGRAQAVSLGVAAAARDVLAAGLDDGAVAEAACGLLWNVTADPCGREAAIAADCVPFLVAALRAASGASAHDVIEAVCGALYNLAGGGAVAQAACVDAAALDALAVSLKKQADAGQPSSPGAVGAEEQDGGGAYPARLALLLETFAALSDRGRSNGAPHHSDVFPTLVRILRVNADAHVALGACRVAWFLGRNDENKRAAIGTGLFGALLDVAITPRAPLAITKAASSAITNFSILPIAREGVISEAALRPGAVATLLGVLSACSAAGDATSGSSVCQALLSIIPDPSSTDDACVGVPPETFPLMAAVFMGFLRSALTDAVSVRDSVSSLRSLLTYRPHIARFVIDEGGVELLFAVLRRHLAVAFVADCVCVLLWTLAADERAGADVARPLSRAAAIIDAAVTVLATHTTDVDASEAACGMLMSMATFLQGSHELLLRASAALCGALGRPLLAAEPRIVAMACSFHNNAHIEAGDEAAILGFGAAPLFEAALRTHGSDEEVATRALGAMSNLCGSSENAGVFARLGPAFFDLFVATLRAHERSESAVLQGLGALSNLAISDDAEAALVAAGAIPALLSAVESHGDSAEVVENAVRAMGNLTSTRAHRLAAAEAGCRRVFEELRSRFDASSNSESSAGLFQSLLFRLTSAEERADDSDE